MVSSAVHEVAEEMPEHQSSRGAEFRNLSVEDRYGMARAIVIARAQATASGKPLGGAEVKWKHERFRYHMRRKKETYMYHAGRLSVDAKEASAIWWSMVYDNPAPVDKNQLGLI